LLLGISFSLLAQTVDTLGKKRAYGTLHSEDLKQYVETLTSREFFGREVGSNGANKAAAFISTFYGQNGLEDSVNENSKYLQPFRIWREVAGEASIIVGKSTFSSPTDIILRHGELSSAETLKVVFVGFGDSNNFDSLDIKGKAVLLLTKESLSSYGYATYDKLKANHCAVVFVINPYHPERFDQLIKSSKEDQAGRRYQLENEKNEAETSASKVTEIYLSSDAAKAISGVDVAELLQLAEKSKGGDRSAIRTLAMQDVLVTASKVKERAIGYNVVGVISGTDKAKEVVAITAHYDHLGGHDGVYYPGADDNASGVASLLEIAQAFRAAEQAGYRPRRTIAFIAFSGEESGLLGSKYLVAHNPLSGKQFVANINLDMVGRQDPKMDNTKYLYATTDRGDSFLYSLADSLSKADSSVDLSLSKGNYMFFFGSDQYSFYTAGIPSLLFFRGLHADYHQPSDTADKLNYNTMVRIARLAFDMVWNLSDRTDLSKNMVTR